MPLLLPLVVVIFSSMGSDVSGLIVDCDVERLLSGFFSGPKWVSLNSVVAHVSQVKSVRMNQGLQLFVRFHDMMSRKRFFAG